MFWFDIQTTTNNLYIYFIWHLEEYLPKFIWALLIIWIWALLAFLTHKLAIYLFKRFKIMEMIDKFSNHAEKIVKNEEVEKKHKKGSENIQIDKVIAKALSYYVFLIFFRLAIVAIWIEEVEEFLWDLLTYLPSLFIAAVIAFFWIRFANFIHDIVFHTLKIWKQKNSKIIAKWIKILVLFFTLMVVLDKIWIAQNITQTIFIWFISMISIAWWLAFWLWWKDLANDILEWFKK